MIQKLPTRGVIGATHVKRMAAAQCMNTVSPVAYNLKRSVAIPLR